MSRRNVSVSVGFVPGSQAQWSQVSIEEHPRHENNNKHHKFRTRSIYNRVSKQYCIIDMCVVKATGGGSAGQQAGGTREVTHEYWLVYVMYTGIHEMNRSCQRSSIACVTLYCHFLRGGRLCTTHYPRTLLRDSSNLQIAQFLLSEHALLDSLSVLDLF